MLVKRQENKPWSIPKGRVTDGEDVETAARRELLEETGLQSPRSLEYIGYIQNGKRERLYCFIGHSRHRKRAVAQNEIRKARFVDARKCKRMLIPYQLALIEYLENLQRDGRSA